MGAYLDYNGLVRMASWLLAKLRAPFKVGTDSAYTDIKGGSVATGSADGDQTLIDNSGVTLSGGAITIYEDTSKGGESVTIDYQEAARLKAMQAGVMPEMDLSDIDLDFSGNAYFEYTQGKRPLQYKVTSMGFVAGLMELIPDELGHVLVQKITGQFSLSGGQYSQWNGTSYYLDGTEISGHQDGKCCSYYRVFNFSSPYLDEETFPKMQWSKWMNEPYYNLLPFLLQPTDSLKLSELTRPSAGTIAMKKLRTQYLAFATDGTNEIGGLYIEDAHTMLQAKQGTPIKLGWRGGNVGFNMDSNGHAGIGYATGGNLPTIDTSARLTVDGNLRVLGQVIADEQQAPLGTVGNPHPLTTDSDLNDIKEGGWYYFDKYNQSTMPANTPPSVNTSFSLLVTPQCNNVGGTITYPGNYQILFIYKILGAGMTSSFFIRLLTTNGIKTWQKLDLTSLFTPDE